MYGEDRPNMKTQLIIGALKFAEFLDNDYGLKLRGIKDVNHR